MKHRSNLQLLFNFYRTGGSQSSVRSSVAPSQNHSLINREVVFTNNNHHKSVLRLRKASQSCRSSYCSEYSSDLRDFDDTMSAHVNKLMVSIDKKHIKHALNEKERANKQIKQLKPVKKYICNLIAV
jgi:galactokinase